MEWETGRRQKRIFVTMQIPGLHQWREGSLLGPDTCILTSNHGIQVQVVCWPGLEMPSFGAWFQIISVKLTVVYTFIDVVCLEFWILENFKYVFKCLKQIKESQNYFRDQRIQLFHFLDGKTEAQRGDTVCPRPQLANERGMTQTKLGLSFKAPQTQSSPCVPGSLRKLHSIKKPLPSNDPGVCACTFHKQQTDAAETCG